MSTPYKFNAKELDSETGLYYYGARYYTPELSIWLSVDPLSDERPSLSPYNYCQWNPVMRVDPTGMLDDNYTIHYDGTIYKEVTNDPTNTYTFINRRGKSKDLGTYNVVQNSNGEDMVEAGQGANGSNHMFQWSNITSGNLYFEEDAFAGLLGGIQNFYDNSFQSPYKLPDKVQINQFMSLDRMHSGSPNRNSALDVAFYRNDGSTGALTTHSNISQRLNTNLLNSFKQFGLGSSAVYSSRSANSNSAFFSGTKGLRNHHHHFHFDGFNKNIGTQLPTFTVVGKRLFDWSSTFK